MIRKYAAVVSLIILPVFILFSSAPFLTGNVYAAIPGPIAQELSMTVGIFKQISKLAPEPLALFPTGKPKFQTNSDAVTFAMSESGLDSGLRRNDEGVEHYPDFLGHSALGRSSPVEMRVSFDAKSDTVKKRFLMKNGQDTASFTMELDNNSAPFKQFTVKSKPLGSAQVYQRPTDTIIYLASQSAQGAMLKEWIQATAFNHSDNLSQYTWKFSTDSGASVTLKQQPNGSVNVYRTMKISGIDNSDLKKRASVMDTVRKALNHNVAFGDEKPLAILEPLVYWTADGVKKTASYIINADNALTVSIKESLSNYPLLIDPSASVVWGQWLGGKIYDLVLCIAVNGSNIYVGGESTSKTGLDGITMLGEFKSSSTRELFVIKIFDNPVTNKPELKWGQWLGGKAMDSVNALAVNGNNIYVGGTSNTYGIGVTSPQIGWETTFLGTYSGHKQKFVIKIIDGILPAVKWGQWLGEKGISGPGEEPIALAVNSKNIYVGGWSCDEAGWEATSWEPQKHLVVGADGFVVKLGDESTKNNAILFGCNS